MRSPAAPPSGPMFVREVQRGQYYEGDYTNSQTITLTGNVSAGERLVLLLGINALYVTGVTDNKGNTYTIDQGSYDHSWTHAQVVSTVASSALVPGDVISLALNGTFSGTRMWMLCVIGNTTAKDVSGYTYNETSNITVTTPSTTVANTLVIGAISIGNGPITPLTTDGTMVGEIMNGGNALIVLYKTETTIGAKSIGVTTGSPHEASRAVVAYK